MYSCATCSDSPEKQAAICLACALECHDNHEVYELYTKRNYRCDCGNSKFRPDFECKLMDKQKKALFNENNKYNHNFVGRYCICDKKYPPDENDNSAESQDEMLQCIVCEDWYHSKHLGAKELPAKFEELICEQCVEKLDFVRYYKSEKSPMYNHMSGCILEGLKREHEAKRSQDTNSMTPSTESLKGPLFWSDCDWRAKLCRCQKCLELYKVKDCEYLLDDKDTVQYYEAQGKAIAKSSETPFERGMSALNNMPRTAVVEALHGYDELKSDLRNYLKEFAATKKVVREEDIHEFFSQLKSKKRPRLEYE